MFAIDRFDCRLRSLRMLRMILLHTLVEQITTERKDQLTTSLSDNYSNICDQDLADSKLIFGGDLAENVRLVNATYSLNQSICATYM